MGNKLSCLSREEKNEHYVKAKQSYSGDEIAFMSRHAYVPIEITEPDPVIMNSLLGTEQNINNKDVFDKQTLES